MTGPRSARPWLASESSHMPELVASTLHRMSGPAEGPGAPAVVARAQGSLRKLQPSTGGELTK